MVNEYLRFLAAISEDILKEINYVMKRWEADF